MDPAIRVEGVSKSYSRHQALSAVDLAVERGSIVGLVGPNGAGKTTLLRILVGALRADAGRVSIFGRDPFKERREVRTGIGYMPQAAVLYPDLTVHKNIAFFARGHMKNGTSRRVTEVLGFVDLGTAADRLAGQLSGGQQQRVSLAAALVHEPQILFLDEPTAGVDPELRHAFWQKFRALADSGVTIVVSTHQMDEVIHCDRVAILRAGGVLADTTPAELFASGGATVTIHRGAELLVHRLSSLSTDLPRSLYELGLDREVTRIEVDGPTLEELVLELIDPNEEGRDVV